MSRRDVPHEARVATVSATPCSLGRGGWFKDASRRRSRLPSALLEPFGLPALIGYVAGT